MHKVTVFYLISSNFFVNFFLGTSYFTPHVPNKDPPAYYFFLLFKPNNWFFRLLDLKTGFLDLKTNF